MFGNGRVFVFGGRASCRGYFCTLPPRCHCEGKKRAGREWRTCPLVAVVVVVLAVCVAVIESLVDEVLAMDRADTECSAAVQAGDETDESAFGTGVARWAPLLCVCSVLHQ